MNDSGMGILGVVIGAAIVVGILFFAFGGRFGSSGPATTVKVEAPHVPSPTR